MQELANTYLAIGIAGFIIIIAAYILIKHVIPHWKEKSKNEQDFQHKQIERVQNREDQIIKEMTSAIRQNTEQSASVSNHLEALTQEIRAGRR